MKLEKEYIVSKVLRDWENKVGPNHTLSPSEVNVLAEKVGLEFCKCEPLEHILKNLETRTSFLHTFGEVVDAFYIFCQNVKEVVIYFVKLLFRK